MCIRIGRPSREYNEKGREREAVVVAPAEELAEFLELITIDGFVVVATRMGPKGTITLSVVRENLPP